MSKETELQPTTNKLDSVIRLLEEKLCREYSLTPEEVQEATVTIRNGEVTIKVKGKK